MFCDVVIPALHRRIPSFEELDIIKAASSRDDVIRLARELERDLTTYQENAMVSFNTLDITKAVGDICSAGILFAASGVA